MSAPNGALWLYRSGHGAATPADCAAVTGAKQPCLFAAGARRLLKPMVLAKLIQAAAVGEGDRVLDVGCATDYASAILARLAGRDGVDLFGEVFMSTLGSIVTSTGVPACPSRTGPRP
jgi:Protein-L-isoaspartate(D-aspartate) O-methyltransferase (PCMT)